MENSNTDTETSGVSTLSDLDKRKGLFADSFSTLKIVTAGAAMLVLALYYISIRFYSPHGNRIVSVDIENHRLYAEVVSNSEKMGTGLGGRRGLCSSCGMLFKFPEAGKYSFWMNDMRFPLDLIWIHQGEVVYIEKNIQPNFAGVLIPTVAADDVLELNAGSVESLGLEIGDDVSF